MHNSISTGHTGYKLQHNLIRSEQLLTEEKISNKSQMNILHLKWIEHIIHGTETSTRISIWTWTLRKEWWATEGTYSALENKGSLWTFGAEAKALSPYYAWDGILTNRCSGVKLSRVEAIGRSRRSPRRQNSAHRVVGVEWRGSAKNRW